MDHVFGGAGVLAGADVSAFTVSEAARARGARGGAGVLLTSWGACGTVSSRDLGSSEIVSPAPSRSSPAIATATFFPPVIASTAFETTPMAIGADGSRPGR